MATFFLGIIYLAFISLGLPDSLLGVTWPIMKLDFNASLGAVGFISMIISGGTILSSAMSGKILKRFGTGKVTFVSVLMTACALLGFSFSSSFMWLVVLAIPLGLGAGSVDAGLNNYVANNYESHHMSWLHCFWGVGAMCGPMIMSNYINNQGNWRGGYLAVAMVQFTLVVILFLTLPLWNKVEKNSVDDKVYENEIDSSIVSSNILKLKGVKPVLISFFFYCSAEATMGLWGSSYLINTKGLDVAIAAQFVAMFYVVKTVGRLVTGFITMKVSNKNIIRMGLSLIVAGTILLLLPLANIFSLIAFIMIGSGCAPIFPCMLHETPARFRKENAQSIMGIQMACAYVGSTLSPPIFGWIASNTTVSLLPIFILGCGVCMIICMEKINLFMRNNTV